MASFHGRNPDFSGISSENGVVASYRRVFQLSPEIDRERISARVEQGVVSVSLPKAQKPAPRRIAVV